LRFEAQGWTVARILAVPMHSKQNRNIGVVMGRKQRVVKMGIVHVVGDVKKLVGCTEGRINKIAVVMTKVTKAATNRTVRTACP
jgi:hypothetical protein